MNIKALSAKVTSKAGLKVLAAKQNSPKVMFAAGIVGVVATAVLASRATLKLEAVLEETEANLARIPEALETRPEVYSEKDAQNDRIVTYAKAVVKIGKLYGPAILVGATSIGLLTGAHVTLNRRNAGLVAAYATIETAFKEYRGRVLDEYGEDKDREFRYGVESTEVISEDEKGGHKVETVKKFQKHSGYAKLFGPDNPYYNPTPDYNMIWLRGIQSSLNDQLQVRGWISLNDAYKQLGFEPNKAGQVMGWILDGEGDDYVDFGIYADNATERMIDFLSGREDCILLDFNVTNILKQL